MKRFIYGTIFIFVAIMVVVMIVAEQRPVNTVKYENGKITRSDK